MKFRLVLLAIAGFLLLVGIYFPVTKQIVFARYCILVGVAINLFVPREKTIRIFLTDTRETRWQ